MVAVSHRHHLLNTLARCNRLHLVRPSLTGDRLCNGGNTTAGSSLTKIARPASSQITFLTGSQSLSAPARY